MWNVVKNYCSIQFKLLVAIHRSTQNDHTQGLFYEKLSFLKMNGWKDFPAKTYIITDLRCSLTGWVWERLGVLPRYGCSLRHTVPRRRIGGVTISHRGCSSQIAPKWPWPCRLSYQRYFGICEPIQPWKGENTRFFFFRNSRANSL